MERRWALVIIWALGLPSGRNITAMLNRWSDSSQRYLEPCNRGSNHPLDEVIIGFNRSRSCTAVGFPEARRPH
ncbi:hypothetical protein BDV37DRAFT_235586 [Aspergillus pseudonomiae]|uniref:Secreted protein n=1 Tax=Aspergillus pseudonomiae TaxID=1506151 RepID=A0A5N7DUT3_9EURO|nr:uncharacterized protein BDV37DRAFT_235586 [Aspergillus pseudonomiae]KAE8410055.1 hypothetical protein BDV37DRAFT_235586 [Aspergillus pseudonomiae]